MLRSLRLVLWVSGFDCSEKDRIVQVKLKRRKYINWTELNSLAWVRERTIPTERETAACRRS
jgi:acetoin utilization deacetylase AcuC-like enzyme